MTLFKMQARKTVFLFCLSMLVPALGVTQQLPPVEPPLQPPSSGETVLHVQTQEVLVPTLVTTPNGDILYGLKADDFELTDNGVPQKVHVQEDLDSAPISLVLAVQLGRSAMLEFDKMSHLGPMLDLFLSGKDPGQIALVGFDSTPSLLVDFTRDPEAVAQGLVRLQPGDGSAAILDTLGYSVDLLESQPKDHRRVLLLVSESRDHGSKFTTAESLVKHIGATDVLVLSMTFSPGKSELLNDVQGGGAAGPSLNLMAPFMMLINALHKNIPKEIANMSGGEYTTYTRDRTLTERMAELAKRSRNRYLLSFKPSDPTPGLHTLSLRLAKNVEAKIVARADYWISSLV